MTIAELIAELQKHPQDATVSVVDYLGDRYTSVLQTNADGSVWLICDELKRNEDR